MNIKTGMFCQIRAGAAALKEMSSRGGLVGSSYFLSRGILNDYNAINVQAVKSPLIDIIFGR